MTDTSDTTAPRHTYSCALPTRGGVCDCQPEQVQTTEPWPQPSGEPYEDHSGHSQPPTSPFRPGGRQRMFTTSLPLELVVGG
jgi:hypothetical protein